MAQLPSVYIEREPLLCMAFAAIEMFNRECLGYLFGYASGKPADSFVITNAVQLAAVVRRSPRRVHQSRRACRRVEGLIGKAPKLFPYLADFHSHTDQKMSHLLFEPSDTDRKDLSDAKNKFCIIIALARRGKRLLEWGLRDEGRRLRGSLGRFDVHFIAYRVVRDEEEKPVKDEEGIPKTERLPLRVAKTTLRALNRSIKSKKS